MNDKQLTRIHFYNNRKFGFHKKHGWMIYNTSELGACFCGWWPINKPAHIKTSPPPTARHETAP
jgi:hypothetical protein